MVTMLKISFIMFYLLLTLFLLYEEYNLRNQNYLVSGVKSRRALDLLNGISGLVTLGSFIKVLASRNADAKKEEEARLYADLREKKLDEALNKITELNLKIDASKKRLCTSDLKNIELEKELENAKIVASNCKVEKEAAFKAVEFLNEYHKTIAEKNSRANSLFNSSQSTTQLKVELEALEKEYNDKLELQENEASNYTEQIVSKIKNSKFIHLEFNFKEWINSLNELEMFAFIILCFNSIIWNSLLSIIFIYYGDFLIKYFNLEIRFPRIAKFIEFRRRIQAYTVKVNLLIIFLATLPQIVACISVFWFYFF